MWLVSELSLIVFGIAMIAGGGGPFAAVFTALCVAGTIGQLIAFDLERLKRDH
jgi:hypothetical protein